MITVDIDGVKVPINMIKSWDLRKEETYFGGQTTTLNIEYYSNNRCHHHVTITGEDAINGYNALITTAQKQNELDKLERVLKHLKYDLDELEKVKQEKVAAYVSLSNARNELLG